MNNQSIYIICIVAFLLVMIGIGLKARKKVTDASSYITGGRAIGVLVGAGMFAATFLSSSSIIGYVGYLYGTGWPGFSSILGTVVSLFIVGRFLVGKIREQGENGEETIPDFFEDRYYSKAVRGFSALFIAGLYVIFMAVETMGMGKTLSAFLGWDYSFSVILASIVTIAYIFLGGLLAVAVNDTICAFLGIGGIIITTFMVIGKLGGLTSMNNQLAEIDSNLIYMFRGDGALAFVISNAAVWGIGNSSHPAFLGQAYGSKSKKDIMKSLAWSSVIVFLFYNAAMLLGVGARVMMPTLPDPDFAFPMLVQEILPPWGAGILIAAVLSLVISTTDTVLLTAGTAIGNDFIVKTLGKEVSEKERLKITRGSVVVVGILGVILALINPSQVLIFQMLNFGAAGAVFFVPIVFGLYWRRATKEGGLVSMVGGLIAYIVWFLLGSPFGLHAVIIGTIVSVVLMIVVSLNTPEPPKEVIEQFFGDKTKIMRTNNSNSEVY
ncbi:sodium:solute symporter family protein [Sporanaerobacter acetigenes]|uniref:sodium:solute symporter family protein n=1 Tax=Sporanaerobacter acetigenes TaxID=165813 RepID=UPI00104EEFD9|nr:sodium:solute symporter family protein [Sporanaerobacter acetigenes]